MSTKSNEPDNRTALARVEPSAALAMVSTPSEAEERLRELQDFIRRAMVEGSDYGKIPGTEKDTLLQPGAQKLTEIYGLAPSYSDSRPAIERWGDDGSEPLFAYFKVCRLVRKSDGVFVGEGIGSCNSREEKYAGRWVFEREVPDHLDRTKLRKREGNAKAPPHKPYVMYRVPNPAIFDLVNTIEKMAAKRALVMAVIGATRSAGIFTQDLEDMAPEARDAKRPKPQATEAEFEDAPPARPNPLAGALARWRREDATDEDIALLAASADPEHRAMVFGWRIRIAEDAAGLAAVQQDIAKEQHAEMRAAMLALAEKRRQELPAAA